MVRLLLIVLSFTGLMLAMQSLAESKGDSLREVIVSHTDKKAFFSSSESKGKMDRIACN